MAGFHKRAGLAFLAAVFFFLAGTGAHAALPQQVTGVLTERIMDSFYTGSGLYTKLNSQVGAQGIDGLFVRKRWSGRLEVLVVEAKFGGSGLSQGAAKGPQMSRAWIEKSLDQRIESLKRTAFLNPDIAAYTQANKDIIFFENAKRAVARGVYKRRIFHGTISQGQLVITLSGVAEAPLNGEMKTLPVKPEDGPTKKGGSQFWQDTKRGRQLKIPLAQDAFNKMLSQASPAKARFLAAQRKQLLDALGRTLAGHGVTPREAQRVLDAVAGGLIRNSGDLNQITARVLGLPASSVTALAASRPGARAASQPFLRPFPGRAAIADSLPGCAAYSVAGGRASGRTGHPSSKTGPVVAQKSHYSAASKILVPINVLDDAHRLMETCLMADMLYSGKISHKSFFDHSGQILGSVGGKMAGAWAGAKAGAAIGSAFGPWGIVPGIVAGSIAGAIYCSEFFGDMGKQASLELYGFLKTEENEEYQRRFIEALSLKYE